jgi:ABC-type polysaccharide/polyol phosphate export permease
VLTSEKFPICLKCAVLLFSFNIDAVVLCFLYVANSFVGLFLYVVMQFLYYVLPVVCNVDRLSMLLVQKLQATVKGTECEGG